MSHTDVKFSTAGIPTVIDGALSSSRPMFDRVTFTVNPRKAVLGISLRGIKCSRYPNRVYYSTEDINLGDVQTTLSGWFTRDKIADALNVNITQGKFVVEGTVLYWVAGAPGESITITLGDDPVLRAGVENLLGIRSPRIDTDTANPVTLLDETSTAAGDRYLLCELPSGLFFGPSNNRIAVDGVPGPQTYDFPRGPSVGAPDDGAVFAGYNFKMVNEFAVNNSVISEDRLAYLETIADPAALASIVPKFRQASPDVADILGFQKRWGTAEGPHYADEHYETHHPELQAHVKYNSDVSEWLYRRFEDGTVDAPISLLRIIDEPRSVSIIFTRPDGPYYANRAFEGTLRLHHEIIEEPSNTYNNDTVYIGYTPLVGCKTTGDQWSTGGNI